MKTYLGNIAQPMRTYLRNMAPPITISLTG
jgi:hypothetical protein